MAYTTIMINKKLKELLDKLKVHPRQSYGEVIQEITKEYIEEHELKGFVMEIQKAKMKELWDNESDEVWEGL